MGAYGVFARETWAWSTAAIANVFALGGVILGIFALAVGAGPRTEANDIYHRVMLFFLSGGLLSLSTRIAKAALGRRPSGSRSTT